MCAAIERMLPDDRFGDARRVGSWWDRTGRQLDLVGLPERGGPARVSFVGSIEWRERAPFDGNDLRALEAALTLVPGVDAATLLLGVSRSGFDASSSRLDVRLEPQELLRAWS